MASLDDLRIALKNADAAGDTLAAQKIAAEYQRQMTAQQQPKVGVGEDVLRAIGSGAKTGAEQLVGTIEDTGSLGGRVASSMGKWLGLNDQQAASTGGGVSTAISGALNPIGAVSKIVRDVGGPDLTRLYAPSSESIKQDVETAVPVLKSVNYDPQTRLGKFAKTGTEFATGAVAGEARLPAIARRVIEQLGIGGASELAGQATEGTAFEPYARAGVGLLGAAGLSPVVRRGPVKAAEPDWIGGQPSKPPPAGPLTAGQATGSKVLQVVEEGVDKAARGSVGNAFTVAALGHPIAALASVAAPIGANVLLRSPPVQKLLMSAPENARAALTAMIAAHQAGRQPGADR